MNMMEKEPYILKIIIKTSFMGFLKKKCLLMEYYMILKEI